MQTGTISFNPGPVELKTVVNDAFEIESINLKNKQIEIISRIDNGLIAYSDYNMVFTLPRNLISNACKFTHRNGKITVEAHSVENNTHIEVVVADTGVGISALNLENIFRIGHNFRSPGTGNEIGSGLGLILCKELVEKNKVKIWMESEENIGTKVFFILPRSFSVYPVDETSEINTSQRKYLLPDKQWHEISDGLIRLLIEDKVFKNQNITLQNVAEMINTNRVYLSQINILYYFPQIYRQNTS